MILTEKCKFLTICFNLFRSKCPVGLQYLYTAQYVYRFQNKGMISSTQV